jgi:hypothetical protein
MRYLVFLAVLLAGCTATTRQVIKLSATTPVCSEEKAVATVSYELELR